MKSILILFTCYDSNSAYTASWARALHDDLVKQQNVSCFLADVQYLCRSGSALADAVERSDFVVFYGHGQRDKWIALPDLSSRSPNVASIPLVDASTVGVLQGRKVYAGCCWSLHGLGGAISHSSRPANTLATITSLDLSRATIPISETL